MLHRASRPRTIAAVACFGALAALATAGCGDDRIAADAQRTLGTRLGTAPHGATTPVSREAASADDLAAARRYLEATLRVDPNNDGARAALAGLGVPAPDDELATTALAALPGPLALRAPAGRGSSFTAVAFGDVGVLGADVAHAVTPWAVVPSIRFPITRAVLDSTHPIAAMVGVRVISRDSSAASDSVMRARRARLRTVARRHTAQHLASSVSMQPDSTAFHIADGDVARVASPVKHKRTWPWTRAQRWLVAKGVGGGAGAGMVVGAIIGNVPGALLAGSLGGGALGFKKATKIGPAAPYPTPRDSASFAQEKRARDAAAHSDTSAKVAVAHP